MQRKKTYLILSLIVFALIFIFLTLKKDTNPQNEKEIILIGSSLPHIDKFFSEAIVQEELNKEKIELKIISNINEFTRTNDLLNHNQIIAKLDSHLPYTKRLNDIAGFKEKISVALPFYWAHIGLYDIANDDKRIKTWEEFEQKRKNKDNIKILLCDDPIQSNMMLRFLEKLQIIKRKDDCKDENLKNKFIDLTIDSFEIEPNIEITIPQKVGLLQSSSYFQQHISKYDLLIQYPSILQSFIPNKSLIKKINFFEQPSKEDPSISYAISLIIKDKNKDKEQINKLKRVLTNPKVRKLFEQYGENSNLIKTEETEDVAQKINEYCR